MASNATHYAPGLSKDFEFTEERNIIVVGRTGDGKSMLINQIIGDPIMKIGDSPRRVTEDIQITAGTMRFKEKKYEATFIDTVGFGDREKIGKFADENIIRNIKSVMEGKKGIHLIIFVFLF